MQVGIVLATAMVALLAALTPETSYLYEAIVIAFLGFGLGMVMPVMNIAIQNEFKQAQLGVATSSVQLFRGLGSTIGIALFGALLTAGITSNLTDITNDKYITALGQSPVAKQIGSLEDSNTLLTLNTPDVKQKISDGFSDTIESSSLPTAARQQATESFNEDQDAYSGKITHAFSDSLKRIFLASSILMAIAAALVFMLKERHLSHELDTTPAEA